VVIALEALFREAQMLIGQGVPVWDRLRLSPSCPLILPSHVALDRAREQARGANAIGTTGRGIGPAYEDKVARRAVRVADLFEPGRFATKLEEILDFHNFVLERYFNLPAVEFKRTLEEQLAFAERLRPLLLDVTGTLARLHDAGANVLFEGAQGAMLDVDVGTYPFVTSSNTTAGGAATGTGLGPRYFDHVIGIVKAYATRVGAGPFPTELFDDYGEHMSKVGHEFGSVTGRRRRCGWFDAVALRRTVVNSSVSGLCMTKLDVLDGLDRVRICTGYRYGGAISAEPPLFADAVAEVEPVYEDLPGWQDSTAGVCKYAALPAAARRYLERVQEILEVPMDMISTGPDRDHTIVLRPPFAG
jgi:adenylosuccinate synthase